MIWTRQYLEVSRREVSTSEIIVDSRRQCPWQHRKDADWMCSKEPWVMEVSLPRTPKKDSQEPENQENGP